MSPTALCSTAVLWCLGVCALFQLTLAQQTVAGCASYRKSDSSAAVFCQECEEGRYLTLDLLRCLNCQAGCLKCSSAGVCTKCVEGLYLVNSKCESCGSACNKCDGDKCIGCMQNYTYDKQNLTCHRCTIANCTYCGSDGECQICHSGFRRVELTRGSFVCTSEESIDKSTRTILIVCSVILCYIPLVLCCICLATYVRKSSATDDGSSSRSMQSKNPFMTLDNQPVSVDLPMLHHDPDDFEPDFRLQQAPKNSQNVWISQTFDPQEFQRPNLKAQESLPNKYSVVKVDGSGARTANRPADSILSFY